MLGRLSIATWLIALGVVLAAIGFAVFRLSGGALQSGFQSPQTLLISYGALASSILGGLLIVIGIALYVILPSRDRLRAGAGYGSHRTIVACIVLAIAIALVAQTAVIFLLGLQTPGNDSTFSSQVGIGQAITPMNIVLGNVTLELSLLGVLWLRVMRPGIITWTRMGFTRENLGRKVLYGIATGIGILLIAAIVGAIFSQFGLQDTQMKLFSSIKGASPIEFAAVLLVTGPFTAFVEEAFFRGYVFQAYWEQKGTWKAYLFSALIFGLGHLFTLNVLSFLPSFTAIFLMGLALAFVYRRTNSVIPTMIGHGLNNTFAFAALFFGAA